MSVRVQKRVALMWLVGLVRGAGVFMQEGVTAPAREQTDHRVVTGTACASQERMQSRSSGPFQQRSLGVSSHSLGQKIDFSYFLENEPVQGFTEAQTGVWATIQDALAAGDKDPEGLGMATNGQVSRRIALALPLGLTSTHRLCPDSGTRCRRSGLYHGRRPLRWGSQPRLPIRTAWGAPGILIELV